MRARSSKPPAGPGLARVRERGGHVGRHPPATSAVYRVARGVPHSADIVTSRCTGRDYLGSPSKPKNARNHEEARTELVEVLVAGALHILALVARQGAEPTEGSGWNDGSWRITISSARPFPQNYAPPDRSCAGSGASLAPHYG